MGAFITAAMLALAPVGGLTGGEAHLSACRPSKARVDCRFTINGRIPLKGKVAIRYYKRTGNYAVWIRELH